MTHTGSSGVPSDARGRRTLFDVERWSARRRSASCWRDRLRRAAVLARSRSGVGLIACPRCTAPMMRRHYSSEHAVEVGRCVRCDPTWFVKDELEALQILVERRAG